MGQGELGREAFMGQHTNEKPLEAPTVQPVFRQVGQWGLMEWTNLFALTEMLEDIKDRKARRKVILRPCKKHLGFFRFHGCLVKF